MNAQKPNSLGPFAVLTFIYFIVGFLTTVNGQFQGPLKIAFLSHAEELKNTLTTLISFFFFLGYLLNSSLGGKWINRHGYKTTLLRALSVMVGGLLCYALSSWVAVHYGDYGIQLAADHIPLGYFIFLFGSYLMGTSAALLQVVINPYIAAYELPFLMITLCIVLTTVVTSRLHLPDIQGTRAVGGEKLVRSIWSFRHLTLGVVAIFFYVGAEVSIGVNVNLHAMELIDAGKGLSFFGKEHLVWWGLDLGIPALLATLYWGGFMVGRLTFSFFDRISPRLLLIATTTIAILLTLSAILTNNLWVLVSVGLCHSVMWSCIFTLAVEGLKQYTSKASGVFMMGVFGGAGFPVLQGVWADACGSWQWTWLIVILCELVMLYYALFGSRIKEKTA